MDFAVVGMDCVLPGALGAEAWIAQSRGGQPQFQDVPAGRWPCEPSSVLSSEIGPDKTLSIRGGFVTDFEFDDVALDLDIPVEQMDPLLQWVLSVCRGALTGTKTLARDRTALLLANLSYTSTGAVRAVAAPYSDALGANDWLQGGTPWDRWQSGLPATVTAKALGLGGGSTAIDAACASGLYAVLLACDRLAAGSCDAVIAAGVQRADSSFLHLGFSQLRALSASGRAMPLDARADGLLVGEGAAAVLIKRLADAERDGDAIQAVIRGGSLGNDGRSGNLLAPQQSGQLRALRAAYARTGVDPHSVGYVECHATGTQKGDRTELEALAELMPKPAKDVVLGSTKGIIGHTITVAGLAGLIRAVGAVRDGVFPASPTASQPATALTAGPFKLLAKPTPWKSKKPRRAGVSAFGFGGTNAHVIVEQHRKPRKARKQPTAPVPTRIAVVGLAARLGAESDPKALSEVLRGRGSLLQPAPETVRRGLGPLPSGAWVDDVTVDAAALRIPPLEAAQLLPQQLLLLGTAARAIGDGPTLPESTATIVGMGIDLHTAEHVLRWAADSTQGADAIAQPLTPARVQGLMPNLVANRVAATFGLIGPSYTVSAGEASGPVALDHGCRLLSAGTIDAAVVGAVDLPGHVGALSAAAKIDGERPAAEGAIVLVLKRMADAVRDKDPIYAELRGHAGADDSRTAQTRACAEADHAPEAIHVVCAGSAAAHLRLGPETAVATHHERVGHAEALDGMIMVLQAIIAVNLPPERTPLGWSEGGRLASVALTSRAGAASHSVIASPPEDQRKAFADGLAPAQPRHPVTVPHSGPPVIVQRDTWWDFGPASEPLVARGGRSAHVPLQWDKWVGNVAPHERPFEIPAPATAPVPAPAPAVNLHRPDAAATAAASLGLRELVHSLERNTAAMVAAHQDFLALEDAHREQLRQINTLTASMMAAHQAAPHNAPARPTPQPAPVVGGLDQARPSLPARTPRSFDRAALERFASGTLSSCLGAAYADLDRYEPRVRLPMDPLLLVSRVVDIEGSRGQLGPARIITEFDLDPHAFWVQDGKAPPCIVVESGQADLFLVSYLGIDEQCQGQRIYRLLDCDLTFHGERPRVGQTLRHDIRINSFAHMGGITLFYFEYDCVRKHDGQPVLSMRNGVAGFFTPAELAVPQGCDVSITEPAFTGQFAPLIDRAPDAIDGAGIAAMKSGNVSAALGSAYIDADGSTARLPDGKWGLIHRVRSLTHTGGAHGLGGLIAVQDLRDDDWFNPCHFKGDPCMPGTLMFDVAMQAVQVWLMSAGFGAEFPTGTFEPIADLPCELRCRGQVVPGHTSLEYEVRIKQAAGGDAPYAIADVILSVDGTPVVRAQNVGVRIAGERVVRQTTTLDFAHFLEFSIGEHARAFGPKATVFDDERRGPRIPGPPYQFIHRSAAIDAAPHQLKAGTGASIEYDVPPDAWYFAASPNTSMPFSILLEIILQPCGWITAWEGSALRSDHDLYFRNLGGHGHVFVDVGADIGTLTTKIVLTSVSESAGMILTNFDLECWAGEQLVFRGDTHFGYFTKGALATQKGMPGEAQPLRAANTLVDLTDWSGFASPRFDLRMLHRVVHVDRDAGFFIGEYDVDPNDWLFTAHFHQDPVMPGSLGLEGILQLARWVLLLDAPDTTRKRIQPLATGLDFEWKYRGQVLRTVKTVRLVFEVTEQTSTSIRGRATLYADSLPIYTLNDFGVALVDAAGPEAKAKQAPEARVDPAAALLDQFTVDGPIGHGTVVLDPARHHWLADHCPTLTVPAVPMAFAAEIAAEAAQLLQPGRTVIGLPDLQALKWIAIDDAPVELLVVAVADGDTIAVTLAVHHENERFPKLSGPVVHMRAVVQMGDDYPPPPPIAGPVKGARGVGLTPEAFFTGGYTFHGPTMQAVTSLGKRSKQGASAVFTTRADTDLLADGPAFLLDPLMLDTATHPMMSGSPQVWGQDVPKGAIAYPIAAQDMRLYGPRPTGEVRCRLDLVSATADLLIFDVQLDGHDGPWCTFRWTETLVDGGLLGQGHDVIRRFVLGDEPLQGAIPPVEPLEGTLVRLLGTPIELEAFRASDDRQRWLRGWLAAKQAARARLADAGGPNLHPRKIELTCLRDDGGPRGQVWVVTDVFGIDAQLWADTLHPAAFEVRI